MDRLDDVNFDTVFHDIKVELDYATSKWDEVSDDAHTLNDWAAFIGMYTSRAINATIDPDAYKQLIKVAGLAISACAAYHRNQGFPLRHYD